MPDLTSFVIALATIVRGFPGVARDALDRLSNAIIWRLGRGVASPPTPEDLAELRARLSALSAEERRLCVYDLTRVFFVGCAAPEVAIAWDESVALYLGSGESVPGGGGAFRPSSLALGVLQSDDGQTWAAVAVGLVAAAVRERRELGKLRSRAHDAGEACPLLAAWVRERLSAARPQERGEDALMIVLDVLTGERADDRARLNRAIAREGQSAFLGLIASAAGLSASRERTLDRVEELLRELGAPSEAHAFVVWESDKVSEVTPISRATMMERIAEEEAQSKRAELRRMLDAIGRHPGSVPILVHSPLRSGAELILVDWTVHHTNAPGGDA